MAAIKVFVSYSWDSEQHKAWVRKLADDLEEVEGVHVVWDGYDLDSLTDKNLFMESGITTADYIIVVTTQGYKSKADERKGGVGIETFLATAAHWDGLLHNKRTKIILATREVDSTPRYLAGHFFIDFSDDSAYPVAIERVLGYLRGTSRIPRPQKRRTLGSEESTYSFTRIEELIKIGYPNRKAIVNSTQGTDYSGPNRIKYELWQTRSPAIGYFLALSNNINITQTVQHAIEKLTASGLRPADLTVLRPRASRPEQAIVAGAFAKAGLGTSIHEYTYKDYIWEFCIDESLKGMDAPTEVANYTDQSLAVPERESESTGPSALEFVLEILQNTSTAAAHLVVAPGGMGKTSLCLSVAAKLHNRTDLHSSVVVIQAETVKKFVADQGWIFARIDSIYHLYEMYARFQNYDQIFDRATFDLAVLCGNLKVIIDGLDEFTSLFQDRFNLESFLESLKVLHDQLGSSNILLTTRNNLLISEAKLAELNIQKYELLGFDSASCEKYIKRRFRGYADASALTQKVLAQIEKVRLHDLERRVVPFFADIAATVVEDELRERRGKDFEVEEDPTPYPSNNDLTDHIVHSVLRREETRHGLDVSVHEVIQLLSGLVVDYGKRWPAAQMRERLELLYDTRGTTLFAKISLNPLIVQVGDDLELRYSFLSSYFEVLFLIEGINNVSLEKEFVRAAGRMSPEASEFRDVRRYFLDRQESLHNALKALLPKLRSVALSGDPNRSTDREAARKGVAALLALYASVRNGSMSSVTANLLDLYGVVPVDKASTTIEGLFIKGDFPALDFTDLTVVNSKFLGYSKFLSSKFLRSRFLFSSFEGCGNQAIMNTSLDQSMVDASCELGDLREVLKLTRDGKREESKFVELEAKRFLHSFFRGDRFTDNNRIHLKFSNKVPGLGVDRFDRLITNGYLSVKKVKEIDIFYEISESFRPSVRRLLTDNYPDAYMKAFFSFVRNG